MNRIVLVVALLVLAAASLPAEEGWTLPPDEVVKILDAAPDPVVDVNRARSHALVCTYPPMASLESLARPMLRLAGLRFDPLSSMPFSHFPCTGVEILELATGRKRSIALPSVPGGKHGFPVWSPDGTWITMVVRTPEGSDLWIADTKAFAWRRLVRRRLCGVATETHSWTRDGRLLVRLVPRGRGAAPAAPALPEGPNVQETSGKASKVRTYQDLIRTAHDAALFHHHAAVQLALVDPATGRSRDFADPGILRDVEFSPDGRFVKFYRVMRPYPFTVPLHAFARRFEVWTLDGKKLHAFVEQPVADEVPIMGVRLGPRGVHWSPHDPARLLWVEALDGGDPEKDVPHRDRLMGLRAPFRGEAVEILRLEHRHAGIDHLWTPRKTFLSEHDWKRRWLRTWLVDLDDPAAKRLVWDRSVNDAYGDPGSPHHRTNEHGESLVWVDGGKVWLAGNGASPEGDRPFLDRLDLETLKTERVWRCPKGCYERFRVFPNWDTSRIVTYYESPRMPTNLAELDLGRPFKRRFLTANADPAPVLRKVKKRRLTYLRSDGTPLSGIFYLPPDHREGQKHPCVVWAYPRSYSGKETAGQVRGSTDRFIRVSGPSKLFFLLRGYAVLDRATMPVVGDPKTMNDTFVEQISANAAAAIAALAATGQVDPKRVGVGGHSYGAFMTANLLAHTDLFAAGIARSGAYNRTLTPFGFQGERRTFWEAPEIYVQLSPFSHADKVNEPLLLIHGERDPNPGTFPVQSERFFHALKGHGATARLVLLPLEGHGYEARTSILHCLAEMFAWFDRHVKARKG